MKKLIHLLFIALPLYLISCSSEEKKQPEHTKYPTGTIVLSDSMRIEEDSLNELYFSVMLVATDSSSQYKVRVAYGYNAGDGIMAYPDLGEPLKPDMIENPDKPYSYIIGFRKPSDDYKTFYDYFEVESGEDGTLMKYIKAYYLQ